MRSLDEVRIPGVMGGEIVPGRVIRLGLKPRERNARGLPKRSVHQLTITRDGVAGDFNRWRTEEADGDPDQAILLLSEEILIALRVEGWPVSGGDLGENLTVSGLAPDAMGPGVRVRAGDVILEVSKPCEPCRVLHSLPYVGPERGPAFVRTMKGRRGWFARVVRGGTIGLDAPVLVGSADPEGRIR